jgi:UDPglucose 6-dehydrogenase
MKLTVIGCGYLGATHAACMAELGHEVLGMDCDMDKVTVLGSGKTPFFERGLDDLLAKHTKSGRLRFTASYAEAAAFGDLHFIGVGTPQQPGEHAYDLTHLFIAVRQLAPRLKDPAVVAVKSTVPVGTAPRVRDLLHEYAPAGDAIKVAWNPEFLRESFAVEDTLRPDRLVLGFGIEHSWAETVLLSAYTRSSPTGPPPNSPRHPPTPSSPRRSPSSTPSPRSAKPPAPTSPSSPTSSATTHASAAAACSPASASAAAASPRTSAGSWPAPANSASTRH